MKKQTLRIFKSIIGAALLAGSIQASAQTSSKIADCTAAADASNPAESLQVYFQGGDASDATQYSIHYTNGSNAKDYTAQIVEKMDDGSLGLRFYFFVAQIYNGHSTNSTLGVALGGAPRNMTCDAKF